MSITLCIDNQIPQQQTYKIKVAVTNYESRFETMYKGCPEKTFPLEENYTGQGFRVTVIFDNVATMFKFQTLDCIRKSGKLYLENNQPMLEFEGIFPIRVTSLKLDEYVNGCLPIVYTFSEAIERNGKCCIL